MCVKRKNCVLDYNAKQGQCWTNCFKFKKLREILKSVNLLTGLGFYVFLAMIFRLTEAAINGIRTSPSLHSKLTFARCVIAPLRPIGVFPRRG